MVDDEPVPTIDWWPSGAMVTRKAPTPPKVHEVNIRTIDGQLVIFLDYFRIEGLVSFEWSNGFLTIEIAAELKDET
jgi:hypothetical protein